MRLKEYFFDEDNLDISLVRNPGEFIPPSRNKELDQFIDSIQNLSLKQWGTKKIRSNLSPDESQSLKLLKNRNNIEIKEADKGSAIVIMDKTFYREKITDMLSDTETYATMTLI